MIYRIRILCSGAAITAPIQPFISLPLFLSPKINDWMCCNGCCRGAAVADDPNPNDLGFFLSLICLSSINSDNGAICAVKEVDLPPQRLRQLEQEIEVLSQLRHANIVQYYGSEMIEGRLYIFMEFVHPGSLIPFIQERFGLISEFEVRQFTRHILSGLAYLHSYQIIHRDIKGTNLLVDQAGVVKLADFGIAKHLTVPVVNLPASRRAYWMAPELIQASVNNDDIPNLFAADIWSLGCTIIEMLTGKPPWGEYESVAAMFKILRATPPIPETLSLEGRDFLRCCFERNPTERPGAAMLLEHPFVNNVTDVI